MTFNAKRRFAICAPKAGPNEDFPTPITYKIYAIGALTAKN
jgi:hypothetical protein